MRRVSAVILTTILLSSVVMVVSADSSNERAKPKVKTFSGRNGGSTVDPTQQADYAEAAETEGRRREALPRTDCRIMTKEYLDRTLNGPLVEQLDRELRESKERVSEISVSAAHPEGKASDTLSIEAQAAHQKALGARMDFERDTLTMYINPLFWVCRNEALLNAKLARGEDVTGVSIDNDEGVAARLGDMSVLLYVATETFLGVYDSVYSLHQGTVEAMVQQFSTTVERVLKLIDRVIPSGASTRSGGKLIWGDVFWLLASEVFPLAEIIALTIGCCLTISLLYITTGISFPIITFYFLGYQYIWMVWVKAFLLASAIRGTSQHHPEWSVDRILYSLVMETDYGMQITAVCLSVLFLIAAIGSFLFLPWFKAVFAFPRKLRILNADGRVAADKV